MAWKPIRAEPVAMSRYQIYRWYDTAKYLIAEIVAESGLCIQDVARLAASGADVGNRRRATLFQIGGMWCRVADLDYTETPFVEPICEQLKLNLLI